MEPFRLCLAGGREIPVVHPERLMVVAEDRTAAVYVPREGYEILDLPLITAITWRPRKPSG